MCALHWKCSHCFDIFGLQLQALELQWGFLCSFCNCLESFDIVVMFTIPSLIFGVIVFCGKTVDNELPSLYFALKVFTLFCYCLHICWFSFDFWLYVRFNELIIYFWDLFHCILLLNNLFDIVFFFQIYFSIRVKAW